MIVFSLPAIINVLLLLVLIVYIFALLGVTLYKELPLGEGAVNDRANFSTLPMVRRSVSIPLPLDHGAAPPLLWSTQSSQD
jgi:hypothetical protein